MNIAGKDELAELQAAGVQLVDLLDPIVMRGAVGPPSEEEHSEELGRLLIVAVLMAAEEVDWLNRPYLMRGLGIGLGEVATVNPTFLGHLVQIFNAGAREGVARSQRVLKPQGSA